MLSWRITGWCHGTDSRTYTWPGYELPIFLLLPKLICYSGSQYGLQRCSLCRTGVQQHNGAVGSTIVCLNWMAMVVACGTDEPQECHVSTTPTKIENCHLERCTAQKLQKFQGLQIYRFGCHYIGRLRSVDTSAPRHAFNSAPTHVTPIVIQRFCWRVFEKCQSSRYGKHWARKCIADRQLIRLHNGVISHAASPLLDKVAPFFKLATAAMLMGWVGARISGKHANHCTTPAVRWRFWWPALCVELHRPAGGVNTER